MEEKIYFRVEHFSKTSQKWIATFFHYKRQQAASNDADEIRRRTGKDVRVLRVVESTEIIYNTKEPA